MASYFRQTRDVELSTIKYLSDSIAASWTGITVVKSFPQDASAALPVVAIYLTDIYPELREIGSTTLINDYQISIDIFAKSDGQRLDLADFILDKLRDPWTYYEVSHASGSTTLSYTSTAFGIRTVEYITNTKVDLGEAVEPYERFRHSMTINVRKT